MESENWEALGTGNWIEICDAPRSDEAGHVDIPLVDLTPITVSVLRRGLLSPAEAEHILDAAAEFLLTRPRRQH
jgi:hypothetical protein